jgi:ParB family chromosome partitioning protein
MKLDFIDLGKLSVSPANMRHGRKAPDISDILPSVRARGVLVLLLVRPNGSADTFEIVAGRRRFHAAQAITPETGITDPLPCAILTDTDEAAATFGLPDLTVRRVLALGNLLPRIRDLHRREKIDRVTVRHLTLASKSQQKTWLALYDDPESYVPTGHQLKAFPFGGQSIPARFALFDLDGYGGQTIADLFGDDRYFADTDCFWDAQNAGIDARKAAYLDAGWSDVVIVPPSEHFHAWEYEKAGKRKAGRVYIDVRSTGEVSFHEGYLSAKEARRAASGDASEPTKVARPEVTSTMQTYLDLHRHAAVRAALLGHPGVALRLMVAHAIGGSHLWRLSPEPQTTRNDDVRKSVETCLGETVFDECRRAVLGLLDLSPEEPTLTGGNDDDHAVVGIFLRLIDLPDPVIMEIITIVMGETLASGSEAVAAVGTEIGIDMADWWQADTVFFELIRDKDVLNRLVVEVAGEAVATANAGEKSKTVKAIVRAHLDGTDERTRVERWVPKWLAFPASAYTARGGVGSVIAHAKVEAARYGATAPDPDADQEPFAQAA